MRKINKVFSLVMVLALAACTFFSTAAFASNIEGYVGNIGILGGGGDVLRSGMSFPVGVISSKGQAEDVSALKVTWSVGDSSEVSITPTGYDSESNSWGVTVKFVMVKQICNTTV